MIALIICTIVSMAPLFGDLALLLDMIKCPPVWLRAFDSERYNALLWPARTMSLARYVTIASG
jgi:hypothetical protein